MKFSLSILCGLFWLQVLAAQGDDAWAVPAAPEGYVLDETGFFRGHEEKGAEVSRSLQAVHQQHGYPVYLAVFYSVFEGTLEERARALHQAWLGEQGQGMVIVYQRDPVASGKNPEVAYYRGSEFEMSRDADAGDDLVIPARDAEGILAKVYDGVRRDGEDTSPVDYVCGVVFGLERELGVYFAMKPAGWKDAENMKLLLWFIAGLVLIGLLGFFCWRLFFRGDVESNRARYFPDVTTGQRLGAPFGGGWTSERTFSPSASQR